jgi:hypothetical protein
MTGSAARGRWARRDRRSCRCRRHAGLCRDRGARCCGSRCHSRLGSNRRMCGRRSNSSRRSPGRARRHNAGARCCTRRSNPRRGRLASKSGSRRTRGGAWPRGLRCRWRRCGRRWTCCGLGLCSLRFGFLLRFGGRFRRGEPLEMLPHKFGVVQVERARVRLLFRDADLRQVIDQDLGLDLEFSGQLVDADLVWI